MGFPSKANLVSSMQGFYRLLKGKQYFFVIQMSLFGSSPNQQGTEDKSLILCLALRFIANESLFTVNGGGDGIRTHDTDLPV